MSPRLGRGAAQFNRHFTNRLLRPLAARLPGFGVVVHRGRRSGRRYRTPVNVFRGGHGYVVALTYGSESDWVRNAVAAGGFDLVTRGRRRRVTSPELFHDESRSQVPGFVRPLLRLLDVDEFMHVVDAPDGDRG